MARIFTSLLGRIDRAGPLRDIAELLVWLKNLGAPFHRSKVVLFDGTRELRSLVLAVLASLALPYDVEVW
jgi:hypothetical protein